MGCHVLFLTPQLPFPPRQGTALRNWGLIKSLSKHVSVSLLSMAEDGQSIPEAVRTVCRHVWTSPRPRRTQAQRLRDLAGGRADLARRLWSPACAQVLRRALAETRFDLVQVEALEMASYVSVTRAAAPAVPIVYDAHNAEHIIQARALSVDRRRPPRWPAAIYSALQVGRLRKYEAWACRAADLVTCVSREDAAALGALAPELQPLIVPNGIDLAAYAGWERPPESGELVFTGKMDYRPNVDAALWFATEIMPRVRAHCPKARCLIVGQRPPPAVAHLDGRHGIVVTGEVADAIPYIAQAAVYVAPLRLGGGTRFKLLEAMALGRPIVSTSIGAEGFEVRSGRELLLADTPEAFAAAVVSLLEEPELARDLGRAGRAFVEKRHDWDRLIPTLAAAYDDLLSGRSPKAAGG